MTTKSELSREQRAVLAGLLQSRKEVMESQSASHLHGLSQAESARQILLQDSNDATQQAGQHEVEGSLSDIDSEEFDAIRSALGRIDGAGYGLCIDCQSRIPFERLRAEPQALRCVGCETLHERKAMA
jgi:RNA polymerase-binding transcription factor DksA